MNNGESINGLKTKLLQAAIANGMNQPNTSAGKLNDATPQNTPSDAAIDTGRDMGQGFSLQQGRSVTGHFHNFDDPLNFAARFADVLGLVDLDRVCEILEVFLHGRMDRKNITDTLSDRHFAPL